MRIDNAYKTVGKLRRRDKRYDKLISKIESRIEYEKSLSVGTFRPPNINFKVRTGVKLSKGEIKVIRTYLNDKYFYYTPEYKMSVEYKKGLFREVYIVKLI